MAGAGYNRTNEKLNELLDTMVLKPGGSSLLLQSNCTDISKPKPPMSVSEAQSTIAQSNIVLVNGLVELCKVKPVGTDAVKWLGEWLLNNNPNKPRIDMVDE